jgi:hypothetical protein
VQLEKQIPSTPASQELSPGTPACGNDNQKSNNKNKSKSKKGTPPFHDEAVKGWGTREVWSSAKVLQAQSTMV